MLIAPNFVFVHLSKTGGTFVESTVRELLCASRYGRKLHRLRKKHRIRLPLYRYRYEDHGDQHALCNDIPVEEEEKTILSCIRNPFDLYVSEYTFNWWKKYPELWFRDVEVVEKMYPDWKNVGFEEFISLSNQHASWVQRTLMKFPQAERLGWYSHKFVYYFCRDHNYVFEAAADSDEFLRRVQETMYAVHFIHTENLNRELFEFLLSKGYARSHIEQITKKEKINSSRRDANWRKWYSDGLRKMIEEKDKLIFQLFPEYRF